VSILFQFHNGFANLEVKEMMINLFSIIMRLFYKEAACCVGSIQGEK